MPYFFLNALLSLWRNGLSLSPRESARRDQQRRGNLGIHTSAPRELGNQNITPTAANFSIRSALDRTVVPQLVSLPGLKTGGPSRRPGQCSQTQCGQTAHYAISLEAQACRLCRKRTPVGDSSTRAPNDSE